MSAAHLQQYQFRKPEPPPSNGGMYLSLIPLTAMLIALLVGPYVTGPALRMCVFQ